MAKTEKGKTIDIGKNIIAATIEAKLLRQDPNDRNGRIYAELVVDSLIKKAANGDVQASRELREWMKPTPKELTSSDFIRLITLHTEKELKEFLGMNDKELATLERKMSEITEVRKLPEKVDDKK